jgi:hypothetical protein
VGLDLKIEQINSILKHFPLQQQQQPDGTTTKDDESAETERPIVTLFNQRPFIFQIRHHHRSDRLTFVLLFKSPRWDSIFHQNKLNRRVHRSQRSRRVRRNSGAERNVFFFCREKKREGKEEAQADEWPDQGGGDLFEWITNQRSAGEKGRPAAAAAARCAFKRRAFRPTGPFILANKLHGKKRKQQAPILLSCAHCSHRYLLSFCVVLKLST